MSTPPEESPTFRERMNVVFNQWQSGSLSFEDTVEQLETMREEARTNPDHEAGLENTLGIMNGYRSNFEESINCFERARALYEKAGESKRVAFCDLNLGETFRLTGNLVRARNYFHQAYEQGVELTALDLQTLSLANEGQVWISLGNFDRAAAVLEKALLLSQSPWSESETQQETMTRTDNLCEIHHSLVTIRLHEHEHTEAWGHALGSLETARFTGRSIRIGYAFRAIADVLTELGESPDPAFPNDPDHFYNESIKAFEQVTAEGEIAKTQLAQGISLARRGKRRSAGQLLQQAMATFTRLGMTDDAARAGAEQLKLI